MIRQTWTGLLSKGPTTLLAVLIAFNLCLLGFAAWTSSQSADAGREAVTRSLKIEGLRGTILHLDEVLTMSARMAAVTGNSDWERRYREFEPQLGAAIDQAMNLNLRSLRAEGVTKTNQANDALVEMEDRAFEMIRAGRAEEAKSILFSAEYDKQKQIYASGMTALSRALADEVSVGMRDSSEYAEKSKIAIALAMLVVLTSWALTTVTVRRWQTAILQANQTLEQRVEERTSDLARANDDLLASEERYRDLIEGSVQGILIHRNYRPLFVNKAWAKIHGYSVDEVLGMESVAPLLSPSDRQQMAEYKEAGSQGGLARPMYEYQAAHKSGELVWCDNQVRIVTWYGEPAIQTTIIDISVRKRAEAERAEMEIELRQAQKLEALGTLSSGVAHEINTPLQYVGDNLHFLKSGFADLGTVLQSHKALFAAAKSAGDLTETLAQAEAAAENADLDYLAEEVPSAIDHCLAGVERVSEIVRAIKEFSHPNAKEKSAIDLNHAIATTITVTRNQWKYVADLETDFDTSLPTVPCLAGEFNQVILNLIVNAAHAIEAAGKGDKGRITVSTRHEDNCAEIRVADTGTGVPEDIREQIFNPFFTTKEPGKGTGQGLAISHTIISRKHGGTIEVESELGEGTTFIVRLPIAEISQSESAA